MAAGLLIFGGLWKFRYSSETDIFYSSLLIFRMHQWKSCLREHTVSSPRFSPKIKNFNFFYKNVTACHGFPLEIFKNFPVWDCLACHSFTFKILSCHGLGMACHGMSREVTGCHVTSKGKWGVTNLETQLYVLNLSELVFIRCFIWTWFYQKKTLSKF